MVKKETQPQSGSKREACKCSVCYQKEARVRIECSHKFCMKCISRWAKKKQSCPLCRKSFQKISYGSKQILLPELKPSETVPPRRVVIQSFILPINYFFYWKPFICYQPVYSQAQQTQLPPVQQNY